MQKKIRLGIDIDRIVSSIFVVAGSAGAMTFPFIIGKAMISFSPTAMMVILFGSETALDFIQCYIIYLIPKWCAIKNRKLSEMTPLKMENDEEGHESDDNDDMQ